LEGCSVIGASRRPQGILDWNLERDFRLAPDQANPTPDIYGHPHVWHFLRSESYDPKSNALLSEFIPDAFSVPGLQQWQGPHVSCSEKDKLPAVGINGIGSFQQVFGIGWPNGVVRVHPWATELVIVGWRSPIQGSVSLSATFTMLDPTGGNGILWIVNQGCRALGQGQTHQGGSDLFQVGDIAIREGDFLYFIIDPKEQEHGFDSTRLGITIIASG
jgi:hypothetical protein